MSSYIKDWVSFETSAFVDLGVQEYCFRVGHFSRKFDRRVMIVRLFNELFSLFIVQSENMSSLLRLIMG